MIEEDYIQVKFHEIERKIQEEARQATESKAAGGVINPIYLFDEDEKNWIALAERRDMHLTRNAESTDSMVKPAFIQEMPPASTEYMGFGAEPDGRWVWDSGQHRGQSVHLYPQIETVDSVPIRKRNGIPKQPFYELARRIVATVPLRSYAATIYRFDGCIYRPLGDQELKTLILEVLKPQIALLGNPQAIKSVAEFLLAMSEIQAEPYQGGRYLCLKNGVLDLTNNRVMSHTPAQFFLNYLDVDYSPQEISRGCPTFHKFLQDITFGDEVQKQRILEMIGSLLIPDMSAKVFFHLKGVGDSGKSVLGNLISSFFNAEAVSNIDIFRFGDRFSNSLLVGKRLNCSMDLPFGKVPMAAVAAIKQLTGGDAITVEQKYKQAFSYRAQCKLLFGSNNDLSLTEPDDAFFRREVSIVFRNAIDKSRQDQDLLQKLQQERPAIMQEALTAYRWLRGRNYQFSGMNQSVDPWRPSLQQSPSVVGGVEQFIVQCCRFEAGGFTTIEDLHKAYVESCTEKSLPVVYNRQIFSSMLSSKSGGRIERVQKRMGANPVRGYTGIILK